MQPIFYKLGVVRKKNKLLHRYSGYIRFLQEIYYFSDFLVINQKFIYTFPHILTTEKMDALSAFSFKIGKMIELL
jgi:hypothetical protein